jgi:DNA-binding transcriptional regulator GbsR (MarR family)
MNKKELLHSFGEIYKADRYPPLSGKIMCALYISSSRYLTFNEIQEEVESSKGAVSKNLNLLIEKKLITAIPHPTEAKKRLFGLEIDQVKVRLEELIEGIKFQTELMEAAFQMRDNATLENEVSDFMKKTINMLQDVIDQLEKSTHKYFKE